MMRRGIRQWASVTAVALVVFAAATYAQILHANGPLPSFEVVSVRPWKRPPAPEGEAIVSKVVKVDPGTGAKRQVRDRVDMIVPPGTLIAMAYGLPPESGARIVGGPDWLRQDVDQYEISCEDR